MSDVHVGQVALLALACLEFAAAPTAAGETTGALWASDNLTKVLRSELAPPDTARHDALRLSGGRGETVSAQAVLRTAADRDAVNAAVSDLRHRETGAAIARGQIRLQWVRYIDVTRNSAGVPDDELVAKAPTSLPDPYWEPATISAAAEQSQPIWIELSVPPDAAAGTYDGTLSVSSDDEVWTLPILVHVWDFDLPAERHLSVINWGLFPGVAYGGRTEPDSPAYYDLYREFCTFLVAHRQTDVMGSLDWIVVQERPEGQVSCDTGLLERHAENGVCRGYPPDPPACRWPENRVHSGSCRPRGSAGTAWRPAAAVAAICARKTGDAARLAETSARGDHRRTVYPP
ncbi:MAG: hypothetical protein MUF48_12495 [Pirellulaceae bacterium]|nr:hypothetical protein [Pirellulaceae bacterium]